MYWRQARRSASSAWAKSPCFLKRSAARTKEKTARRRCCWVWRAAHQKSETGEQTEEKEARGWRVVMRVCASYRRERVLISWDDMQREKRKAERKEK